MNVLERRPGRLVFEVDATLYGEDVVFKCFYWYGNAFDVVIGRVPGREALQVELQPKDGDLSDAGLAELDERIKRDLVDFKTRDIVAKETRTIRELLIAKAFAHSDEFDQPPPGDVADPVGFNPSRFDALGE